MTQTTNTPNIQKNIVYVQEWEESERGWGQRPDGYSIHQYEADIAKYVKEYWDNMPDETPDEYSRPDGAPFTGYIPTSRYKEFFKEKNHGIRLYSGDYNKLTLELAEHYATEYHKGQNRCKTEEPFITHPQAIVDMIIQSKKYDTPLNKCIAWLHDTVEDTDLTLDEITEIFGKRISEGVQILTRDVSKDEYNKRILAAPKDIQVIKLCDIIHNSSTLEVYTPDFAREKIEEYVKIYIPLAGNIDSDLACRIMENVSNYLDHV